MLNSSSFPLKRGHFQDQFLGFPDLTGGRWYQVLDLFAQDLRPDVVTFNCAVASCEEIRFTFGFCCGKGGLGAESTDFFFFFFSEMHVFSRFFGMGVIGAPQKGGKLSLSGISSFFLRNRRRLRGDLCYVATLLHRSFQGGQLRWSYCCCVQRTEG